jgi:hypothetical protein
LEKDRRKVEKGEELRVRKERQAVKLLKLQEAKRKEEQEKEERTGERCLHWVSCDPFTDTSFLLVAERRAAERASPRKVPRPLYHAIAKIAML